MNGDGRRWRNPTGGLPPGAEGSEKLRGAADGEANLAEEHDRLTAEIIGCAFAVSNALGCGFLEKVYENALVHELAKKGLCPDQQVAVPVYYDDVCVGEYCADIVVNDEVIVELKAASGIDDVHVAQCLNYLAATRLRVCLLFNFGRPKLEVRRLVGRAGMVRRPPSSAR
jgi:GxxExxY protein